MSEGPAPDQGFARDAAGEALTENSPSDDATGALLEELAAAFRRHRPQGSAQWNFTDAFMRLEREFGAWVKGSALLGEANDGASLAVAPQAPASSVLGRVRRKLLGSARPSFQTTASIQGDGRGRVESGFDATLEALRYLEVRVRTLEEAHARATAPVGGLAALLAPPALDGSAPVIADWLGKHAVAGPVLHVECGDGALVRELRGRGIDATGADPRGDLATDALESGLGVALSEALPHLAAQATSSLGALVLSGIVDRAAIDDVVELVAVGRDRLAENGPIVVISETGAPEPDRWSVIARDLLPGRPLRPETWEVLLARAEFGSVSVLPSPDPNVSIITALKAP